MNNLTTLAAFGAALALVFGSAVGIGNAVGPIGDATHGQTHKASAEREDHTGTAATPDSPAVIEPAGGLSASTEGYTLSLDRAELPLAQPTTLSFQVLGPNGTPVVDYTSTHDKELHLIAVRRDGTGFQHLHPERNTDGRWSTPLTLDAAGSYKVYADTAPAGRDDALTLAADLSVAGDYQPAPLPAPTRTSQVDDYTVTLTGDLHAGTASQLVLSVSRDGRPVTDLQPYLAAYGHLVSLRVGDLAYLHTHPDGEPGDGRTAAGPEITFYADVPTAGSYHLYLDFQHQGVVRTAQFTATAAAGSAPSTDTPTSAEPPSHGNH